MKLYFYPERNIEIVTIFIKMAESLDKSVMGMVGLMVKRPHHPMEDVESLVSMVGLVWIPNASVVPGFKENFAENVSFSSIIGIW